MNQEQPLQPEQEVVGIDTIKGLIGEPPEAIKVPHEVLYNQEVLRQSWNRLYMAIVPYCFKCKEPLVWHINPQGDTLFHCPKCRRRWVKGEGWRKHG